jgi:hypothetical protein
MLMEWSHYLDILYWNMLTIGIYKGEAIKGENNEN